MASNLTPKARVLAASKIIDAIESTRAALAQYAITYYETEDTRNPRNAAARLKRELISLTEPAAVQEKVNQIAKYSHASAAEVAEITRGIVWGAFEPAKVELLELLNDTKTLLQSYLAEARSAEAAFFAAWGVPAMATEASARYARAIAEIDGFIQGWTRPRGTVLPDPNNTPLALWYGVSLLDD